MVMIPRESQVHAAFGKTRKFAGNFNNYLSSVCRITHTEMDGKIEDFIAKFDLMTEPK